MTVVPLIVFALLITLHPISSLRKTPIIFKPYGVQDVSVCCVKCERWRQDSWKCNKGIPKPDRRALAYAFKIDPDRVAVTWMTCYSNDRPIHVGRMIINFTNCTKEGIAEWTEVPDQRTAMKTIYRLDNSTGNFDRVAYSVSMSQPTYGFIFSDNKGCRGCDVTIVRKEMMIV